MRLTRLLSLALLAGVAIAILPAFFPTGPTGGFDAAGLLESNRIVIAALAIFLGGLGTAMTPCVYPLIPITVGVFGARQATTRGRAIGLTSLYIVGMGLVFSALGLVAALTGRAFGSALADPRLSIFLTVFLLLLASSMFGAFEIALPTGLAQRLNTVGGAGYAGAFLMGSVSGFIAAPCTGPVLTGLLAFVAKTQNATLGALLLFIYALGIGVPFFLIGVFAVRLPKGGVWMEWIKSFFGIALVALALSYFKDAVGPVREWLSELSALLGKSPAAWIAGALAAFGVLLGAIHRTFKDGAPRAALKAVGVVLVVLAFTLRGAALSAPTPAGDLWVRLGWAKAESPSAVAWQVHYPKEGDAQFLDNVLGKARLEGRPVMIDFFAEWCAACNELDRITYVDPMVAQESRRFLNVKVDGTNEADSVDALYKRYHIEALPTVIFIGPDGTVLRDPRISGFLPPERFLAEMKKVPCAGDSKLCSRQ